jgi:ABC-type sulfate/molybdate transport systems ATPase subunit
MIAPAVVLLDEPFRYDSRADAESSASMMKWMCERRDEGTTFVVTTDDPFRCMPLCTRTVWLVNGTARAEALT